MARPDVSDFAERVYEMMIPVAQLDERLNWPLLSYLGALGAVYDEVDQGASGGDNGEPPFYKVMNSTTCPPLALDWLGQFVGVRSPAGFTEQQKRDAITNKAGFSRGSVAAIRAAAQQFLTGNKQVVIYERDSSNYHFTVITRTAETPNSTLVLNALLAAKPAGLQMTYNVVAGAVYNEIDAMRTTYNNLDTAGWTNYNDVENGVIGG